jgi:hypothetical protein
MTGVEGDPFWAGVLTHGDLNDSAGIYDFTGVRRRSGEDVDTRIGDSGSTISDTCPGVPIAGELKHFFDTDAFTGVLKRPELSSWGATDSLRGDAIME